MLVLIGAFAIVLALYDTFEYACCYDDEKRKTMREWLLWRIQSERDGHSASASSAGDAVEASEMTRLLSSEERLSNVEETALDTLSMSSDGLWTAENATQLTCDDADDEVIIELERIQDQHS